MFMEIGQDLPANVSVLLRGNHGIGKSQVIKQLGRRIKDVLKMPSFETIDRRLSQMTEGDMIGLPSTDGETTRFNPPDWYKRACTMPVLLFLDELNRATPEVMQAAFQIVLDRELNGWKLHPETRVYAAVNDSASYNVNEIDPALLDRFWCIDLSPTHADWLDWARSKDPQYGGNIHQTVVD
jgi:MoxR-like ATPase